MFQSPILLELRSSDFELQNPLTSYILVLAWSVMNLDALYKDLREQTDDVIVRQSVISTERAWHDTAVEDPFAWAKMAARLEQSVVCGDVSLHALHSLYELLVVQQDEMLRFAAEIQIRENGYRAREGHDLRLLGQQNRVMIGTIVHILRTLTPTQSAYAPEERQAA